MRFSRSWLLSAVALFVVAAPAAAQTTNGTLSGHVADQQGLALPGVTISASSPNLQGVRTTVTSVNGDYAVPGLPSGPYTVSFDLSGFERVEKHVTLAPTQTLPVDAQMGVASVNETVNVVARKVDTLMQTSQVATNFTQEFIQTLPTNRDLTSSLLIAPAVHPTGPGGNFSIGGAMSFESRYLINGVDANETIRGQANNLYIEDAIQETTVATAGISAEYGRFTGGVINVITKSGGNLFSGSFRDSLANDNWRALTSLPAGTPIPGDRTQTVPTATVAADSSYPGDTKFDHVVPTYEYTFGGPVFKDHLWFFTAGRLQNQIANRQTFVTNIPYTLTNDQKRYEANVTYSANANHRFYGAYTNIQLSQINGSQQNIMDLSSLYTAKNPQDLITVNYNGVLSNKLYVEGRVTSRHWTSEGAGSPYTDLVNGTLLIDRSKGGTAFRYWTSTFCGTCEPEKRDSQDLFLKGSYFKPTTAGGSHNMQFGYDTFNDKRRSDNYQSGSNYRISGTSTIIRGTDIFPQFLNSNTVLQYNPLPTPSLGTNFRIHSLFYNDAWRANGHLTLNLGVRWDKNHGENSLGVVTTNDSALSPRVGLIYDPAGDGRWTLTASVAKYVAAVANTIADASSNAGNTAAYAWAYSGPQINANANAATLITSPAAIQQVFDWCKADARGMCTSAPLAGASVPGVSVTIPNGLSSPNALEYAGGVGRQINGRLAARADFTYRDFRDFYSQRIDRTTGIVVDSVGNKADKSVIENTNDLKRRYSGLTLSVTYRMTGRTDVGGNYTLSRLWGNFEGENANTGPGGVVGVPVSGVHPGVLEHSDGRSVGRSAPPHRDVAQLRRAEGRWTDAERAREYRQRCAVWRGRTGQRRAFRDESRLRDATGSVRHRKLLLHGPGCVQDGGLEPDRPVRDLQPHGQVLRQPPRRSVHPGDPAEHVRYVPAVRLRRRLRVPQWRQRFTGHHRSGCAHELDHRIPRTLQPVDDGSRRGRELELRSELRNGDQPDGLYVAANLQDDVRSAILEGTGRAGRGGPAGRA